MCSGSDEAKYCNATSATFKAQSSRESKHLILYLPAITMLARIHIQIKRRLPGDIPDNQPFLSAFKD